MTEVSVIVPTFRREKQVVEAVESALAQRAVRVEVIVLDDSPDASAKDAVLAIGDPRVRYVARATPTGGVPALVRNEGLALARGAFVHFLDDDDRLVEGALAALVGALERTPRAGVAFGWVMPFGDDPDVLARQTAYFEAARSRARLRRTRRDLVSYLLFQSTLLVNSACLHRRDVVRGIGGYDPDIARCEDVELVLRAVRASDFVYVDRPVLHYRTGASSLMHDLSADDTRVADSYRIIHDKYRASHGRLEHAALKAWARLSDRVARLGR